jgi:hypothetical protein
MNRLGRGKLELIEDMSVQEMVQVGKFNAFLNLHLHWFLGVCCISC